MSNKNLKIIKHPVLEHKLGYLRCKHTEPPLFRQIMKEIAALFAYEATRDCPTVTEDVSTPMGEAHVERIIDPPIVVSIMRAGNGMLDGILETLPIAPAGHIGIYRDKFIRNTVEYYFKIPEHSKNRPVLLVDPLLATADTAISCLDRLKQYEVGPIKMLCILVSKDGVERVHHFHPDVEITALSVEEKLDPNGYLLPGIGDAGDRLYGTK